MYRVVCPLIMSSGDRERDEKGGGSCSRVPPTPSPVQKRVITDASSEVHKVAPSRLLAESYTAQGKICQCTDIIRANL